MKNKADSVTLILLDILLTDGMTIVTKNSTIRGEIQQHFKSSLELRNVSRNSPTTFQCIDGRIDNATRKSIEGAPILSFKVLGINEDTTIYLVWRLRIAEESSVLKTKNFQFLPQCLRRHLLSTQTIQQFFWSRTSN
jgi:hypothetical protein